MKKKQKMKAISHSNIYFLALFLPIAANAQDHVTIDSVQFDRTKQAPAQPPKVLHEFKVLSTKEILLEKRKMIIRRVEDPGFPKPTPPTPAVVDPAAVATFKHSPAYLERQIQQANTTSLFISARVVDHRATLLSWWEGGKEYQAWSNLNFNYFTTFSSFSKGDRHFVTFMGVSDVSSASLSNESMIRIPSNLPTGAPDFMMQQGAAGESKGYDAIIALHELYATDGQRLREAYELREAPRKGVEAELLAKPTEPKDIVLNFWKVKKQKDEAEAQSNTATKGGGK